MFSKIFRTSLAVVLLALAGHVQAASLGLTLADEPDIAIGFIQVSYDAMSNELSASGFSLSLDVPGPPEAIAGGGFMLSATIDDTGALSSGSFTISGTVAALGYTSGTLLTGTLTDFGFPDAGGDPLEFLFDVTGGDAAGLYGGIGGIIMTFTGFDGDWTTDFSNGGTGLADVAAIPLPAPFLLMLSALIGTGAFSRRR